MQRRFAHRGKFLKSFNDRGELIRNVRSCLAFRVTKNNGVEIMHITIKINDIPSISPP